MTQETKVTALTLPDEAQFRHDIEAINRFQKIVHQTMVLGLDYGVIPGTGNKPTLLKPGAEKIAKLLGLSDQYEIIDKQENWQTGFFRYLIKCRLVHVGSGSIISEGLGECNSMESKYRWRWVFPDDVPANEDKLKLVKRAGKRKDGKGTYTQYRIDNEDIFSQVNTILKMSKKRALVDAALSAGRLSDVFTQDIEDMTDMSDKEPAQRQAQVRAELSPIRKQVIDKLKGEAQAPTSTPDSAVSNGIEEESPDDGRSEPETSQEDDGIPATIQQLATYCASKGKSYTPSWICRQLNIKALPEITDVGDAYATIREIAGWQE